VLAAAGDIDGAHAAQQRAQETADATGAGRSEATRPTGSGAGRRGARRRLVLVTTTATAILAGLLIARSIPNTAVTAPTPTSTLADNARPVTPSAQGTGQRSARSDASHVGHRVGAAAKVKPARVRTHASHPARQHAAARTHAHTAAPTHPAPPTIAPSTTAAPVSPAPSNPTVSRTPTVTPARTVTPAPTVTPTPTHASPPPVTPTHSSPPPATHPSSGGSGNGVASGGGPPSGSSSGSGVVSGGGPPPSGSGSGGTSGSVSGQG
jgi:uncharacterized membrane protein YgcG